MKTIIKERTFYLFPDSLGVIENGLAVKVPLTSDLMEAFFHWDKETLYSVTPLRWALLDFLPDEWFDGVVAIAAKGRVSLV